MIFDEATRRKLAQLRLVANQVRPGAFKGQRRTTRYGASIEFADYRNYTPGDDLRRVDWNLFARLDRPYVKLHHEEEDLALHLLVDASRSMDWGSGEANKLRYALRLAAALSQVALSAGDQVALTLLGADGDHSNYGPARGNHHFLPLLNFLESRVAGGALDLLEAVRAFVRLPRRIGLAILISDLYLAEGSNSVLHELQGRGHEVVVLHVLSEDELQPALAGDLRLVDSETGAAQEVSLTGGMRNLYQDQLRAWRSALQAECHRRGVSFLPLDTRVPWETAVLIQLRRAGVLR